MRVLHSNKSTGRILLYQRNIKSKVASVGKEGSSTSRYAGVVHPRERKKKQDRLMERPGLNIEAKEEASWMEIG